MRYYLIILKGIGLNVEYSGDFNHFSDLELILFKGIESEKINLLLFNNFIKEFDQNIPLMNNSDYNSLSSKGYTILLRDPVGIDNSIENGSISFKRVYEWYLIVDSLHENTKQLKKLLRDKIISDII